MPISPDRTVEGQDQAQWQLRLQQIVETMREMSRQHDPQEMVRAYGRRMRELMPTNRLVSLSRRDLEAPFYRITRYSGWKEEINPWTQKDRLPLLQGGLLGDLIHGDEPRILCDPPLDPNDPGFAYLEGMRSIMAIPHYDQGVALNMVVLMRSEPEAFAVAELPEWVWMSNLFGRATQNLVLTAEVTKAYATLERELQIVADIQRSLLPSKLPRIPTLDLAVHYQTSRYAGGDYYDFFPLPGGRWGVLIADVSGHGTPAAVMMAITHAIAHTYNGEPIPPGRLLAFVNDHLTTRYTQESGAFVTAFYGIYDPATRGLNYSCAGHNPPRVKRCQDGSVLTLNDAGQLPLGILPNDSYDQATIKLVPGDQLILYTDGITEATNSQGEMFGLPRLDEAIEHCPLTADDLIRSLLDALEAFTGNRPAEDDRTLLVGKVL